MSILSTASLAFSLLVMAAPALAIAATEKADKPVMRSSAPAHVDAPHDADKDTHHPVRVRETERAHGDAHEKININTADVKSLMTLTGVGRSLAEKIVKYRDEHGLFKKPTDLRKVDGVGEALWEKNRERIVVK